ncbi:hypothetical protein MTO96_028055 [Rhipicephalus appendiculatus]
MCRLRCRWLSSNEPLGDVQAAAPVVEALLRSVLPGEPNELIRTPPSKLRCLGRRLGTTQYDSHMPDLLRELLQPSALLQMTARANASPCAHCPDEGKATADEASDVFRPLGHDTVRLSAPAEATSVATS